MLNYVGEQEQATVGEFVLWWRSAEVRVINHITHQLSPSTFSVNSILRDSSEWIGAGDICLTNANVNLSIRLNSRLTFYVHLCLIRLVILVSSCAAGSKQCRQEGVECWSNCCNMRLCLLPQQGVSGHALLPTLEENAH